MFLALCFFANDLLLAVYFILILDYGNNVIQKANSSDFLIQVSMAHKAVEKSCNINNPFGPRTANEHTVK